MQRFEELPVAAQVMRIVESRANHTIFIILFLLCSVFGSF